MSTPSTRTTHFVGLPLFPEIDRTTADYSFYLWCYLSFFLKSKVEIAGLPKENVMLQAIEELRVLMNNALMLSTGQRSPILAVGCDILLSMSWEEAIKNENYHLASFFSNINAALECTGHTLLSSGLYPHEKDVTILQNQEVLRDVFCEQSHEISTNWLKFIPTSWLIQSVKVTGSIKESLLQFSFPKEYLDMVGHHKSYRKETLDMLVEKAKSPDISEWVFFTRGLSPFLCQGYGAIAETEDGVTTYKPATEKFFCK